MLKLLIVDDEPMFREGLIKTINWNALGISVIGEAYNGIEALKILEKDSVDLIITDIRMPEMDGLELIRRVTVEYPDVHFIVLSAFDDFRQVKQAFQLGIVDYILKSEIRESELKEILNRQTEEVRRRKNSPKATLTEYAERNNRLILQQLLRNCVERKFSLKEIPELQNYMNYSEDQPVYAVVLCLHHNEYSTDREALSRQLSQGLSVLESLLLERNEWIGYGDSHSLYLFYIPEKPLDWMEFSIRTEAFRKELSLIIQEMNPQLVLTAGFSSVRKSSILSRQKSEAEKACLFSFFRGIDRSIGYSHYQQSLDLPEFLDESLFRDFVLSLKNRDIQHISENIKKYQISTLRGNGTSRNRILNLFRKYYNHLLSFCEQMGVDEDKHVKASINQFLIMDATSAPLDHMNNWLKESVLLILDKMEGRNSLSSQVCRYLQKNYQNDLSLTDVADFFQVNPSYLSRTFSSHAGMGFSAYLTELRIHKALELMEDGKLKHYEIADLVGIKNPESFSRCFKKVTGSTPRDYCH